MSTLPSTATPSPLDTQLLAVLLPLMLVLFISTLDQTIVATVLGHIGTALSDTANAPWIATAYLLTSAVSTLILGKLGDRLGRKSVFLASIGIFVVSSALCAFAPHMGWLIVFRALQGVGGGGLNSLVMAIVGDLISARERARYQAVLGLVPALAIILGPLLGGLIVDHWHWSWIFLINLPIGIIAFVSVAARLQLPKRRSARRLDIAGGLLAIVFTSAFLLLASFGGRTLAWDSWQIMVLAVTAVMALFVYLRVEHHAAEPMTPLPMLTNPIFAVSAALFFLCTAVLFVAMLYVPLMLQSLFGRSALVSGACIVPLLLGLIVATMLTGTLIVRNGRYRIYPIFGALVSGVALLLLSRIGLASPLWVILLIMTLLGFGLGLFIQVVMLAGQNAVEYRHLGAATGALNFFKTLGGASGAALFGAILSNGLASASLPVQQLAAYQSMFIDAAGLMLATLVVACLLKEKPLGEEIIDIAEGRVEAPEY